MASAARLAPAASSEASCSERLGSWLITDVTIEIISCSRRIFLASSSRSRCTSCSANGRFVLGFAGSRFMVSLYSLLWMTRRTPALRGLLERLSEGILPYRRQNAITQKCRLKPSPYGNAPNVAIFSHESEPSADRCLEE